MPAHRWDGSVWVEATAFVRTADSWTDDDDNLFAWDGADWQLIQPLTGSGPNTLLPVENLHTTSVGDHSVEAEWELPVQPGLYPNEVWVRIPDISEVWMIYDYPVTGFSHLALFESTPYQLQVMLVLRVDGTVDSTSPPRSVFFTTIAAPVGEPAPDPGGGGLTTIPLPTTPGTPGPPAGPGCWWEWYLQIWDVDAWGWVNTSPLVSGTVAGNADIALDMSTLAVGTYRVVRTENCNGVLGTPDHGEPFAVVDDWDALCGGILPSISASLTPFTDAVWQIPHVCTTIAPPVHMAMFDGVSGVEIARGPNYGFVRFDSDSEWGIVSNDLDGSPAVYLAPLTVVPATFAPGESWTVSADFEFGPTFSNHSAGEQPIKVFGAVHSLRIVYGVASCQGKARIRLADGSELTLVTDPISYAEDVVHTLTLRWIDGGLVSLWMDANKEDEDTPATGIYAGPLSITVKGHLPEGMALRKHYGWDRALSDAEIGTVHVPFVTGWWGVGYSAREYYVQRVAGDGIVKLAGGLFGGTLVGTVPLRTYVVSVGACPQTASPSGAIAGDETWGFGGPGGQNGFSGNIDFNAPCGGGGRTELRTSLARATAVVIAPGGGTAGGGGFPDGLPVSAGSGGGFGGKVGQGATASAPGEGAPASSTAGGLNGYDGDGITVGTVQGGTGIGSGGPGGNGVNSFGSGGPGFGGGGGKHGGGGGSGGNGSSTNGGGGGGGSGDTSGLTTITGTWNGNNTWHGMAAMQVLARYSGTAMQLMADHNPAAYVTGEECVDAECIVATELISGLGFWDRSAAIIFEGGTTSRPDIIQGGTMQNRPAIRVSRNAASNSTEFSMIAAEASAAAWRPPAFNAGTSWAIEWTAQVTAGTNVDGPGASSVVAAGDYSNPSAVQRPWNVSATPTTIRLSVAATAMNDVKTATSPVFVSRATNLVTRYGVSYNAATDTFHFYRSDGTTQTLLRTSTTVPTTGQWHTSNYRPVLGTSVEANHEELVQDVAIFTTHRTQAQFNAAAALLAAGTATVITTATGGYIHREGDWIYHEITATGTFTPNGTRDCEIMGIGGGGGAGGADSGFWPEGGASGCVRTWTATLSAATAITIGAAGTAAPGILQSGGPGGDTIVAGVGTAPGGGGGQPGPVRGRGGNNADFSGSLTAPSNNGGGGAGAGGNAPAGTTQGGPGVAWPADSDKWWGSGGGGGPDGHSGRGERGPNSGAGAHPYQQTSSLGRAGRVIIRYRA